MNHIHTTIVAVLLATSLHALAQDADEEQWTYSVHADAITNEVSHQASSPVVQGVPYKVFRVTLKCVEARRPTVIVTMQFGYLNALTERRPILQRRTWWDDPAYVPVGVRRSGADEGEYAKLVKTPTGGELRTLHHLNRRKQTALVDALSHNDEWVLYRFPYYEHGNVDIQVPLEGAKEAIAKVVDGCEFQPKR